MSRECVECGGPIEIVGVSDCTIDIHCAKCGDERTVESDGLGEGGMEWVEAMGEFGEDVNDMVKLLEQPASTPTQDEDSITEELHNLNEYRRPL